MLSLAAVLLICLLSMLKHKFSGKRRAYIVTMRALMTLAALLTAALVLFMICLLYTSYATV